MKSQSSIGVIVLAAGESKRLGKPKQLLTYQNTSLLQRVIDISDGIKAISKVVILGAHADKISSEINNHSLEVLINEDWAEGIASSIRTGISALLKSKSSVKGALFLLSDQPHLTHDHLKNLLSIHRNDQPCITGSHYADQVGVPVIFSHHYFDELIELTGDQGAKKIVVKHPDAIQHIVLEGGEIDIDTIDDYKNLIDT
ncbi:MAG: nucleotidyltransferase family protein [Bacteroidota bacterium]